MVSLVKVTLVSRDMTNNTNNDSVIEYRAVAPSVEDFIQFRADCGWGRISDEQGQKALQNSLHAICAFDLDKMIGFGRLIGDGALNYYVQDLIVGPEYRNGIIGSTILDKLLGEVKANKLDGNCTVGLMAAVGKEAFYDKFGFINRPTEKFGSGMTMDIN